MTRGVKQMDGKCEGRKAVQERSRRGKGQEGEGEGERERSGSVVLVDGGVWWRVGQPGLISIHQPTVDEITLRCPTVCGHGSPAVQGICSAHKSVDGVLKCACNFFHVCAPMLGSAHIYDTYICSDCVCVLSLRFSSLVLF